MDTNKTVQNAVCVRQPSAIIAENISSRIIPIVAEKLEALTGAAKIPSDMRFKRKRIALEFYYEVSSEDPWGDFAKWNIVETTVHEKTLTETKAYFAEGI